MKLFRDWEINKTELIDNIRNHWGTSHTRSCKVYCHKVKVSWSFCWVLSHFFPHQHHTLSVSDTGKLTKRNLLIIVPSGSGIFSVSDIRELITMCGLACQVACADWQYRLFPVIAWTVSHGTRAGWWGMSWRYLGSWTFLAVDQGSERLNCFPSSSQPPWNFEKQK